MNENEDDNAVSTSALRENEEVDREFAARAYDLNRQVAADAMKISSESANLAIRSLILVNGAAVVTLLALLGTL